MKKWTCRVLGCLLAGILGVQGLGAQAVLRHEVDDGDCDRWAERNFARGKVPPFSFTYGGVPSSKLLPRWRFRAQALVSAKQSEMLTAYTWTDPHTGLQVECQVKRFTDFNAVEWVLRFRNTGAVDTPPISAVRTVDLLQLGAGSVPVFTKETEPATEEGSPVKKPINLSRGEEPGATRASDPDWAVYYADGPYLSEADFCSRDTTLAPGRTLHLEPYGGRSSSHTLPYFNVKTAAGGLVYGIGWTGSWCADIARSSAGCYHVKAGLRDLDAYLFPGEEIRTASVFLIPWQGKDRMDGQNCLRRFILAHHHPEASGRPVEVPILTSIDHHGPWPCDEFACLTAFKAEASIRQYHFYGTYADAFWLDAGWYDRAADYQNGYWWHSAVGNWKPDPKRFPDGLAPVADAAHEIGAKLLLWYEPERANVDSDWAHAHPEWMLAASGESAVPLDEPVDSAFIVNLGNPQALEWVCQEMLQSITENKVDIYRQDFNISPEPFWLNNDAPLRRGMTEVKYIEGLYAYLDFLHRQLPHLIMDNCAGGGRRLDFEMVSRSIALLRSDFYSTEGVQCHGYYLNQWLPVNCTGVASGIPYEYRSALAAGINFNWGTDRRGGLSIEGEKALIRWFRGLKDYFLEDFYPLSGYGDITRDNQWLAYQLDRPSDGTGIVVAFRRSASPDSTYTVRLRGLDPEAVYRLSLDPDVAKPGRSIRLGHKPEAPESDRQDGTGTGVTQPQRSEDGRSRTCTVLPADATGCELTGRELAEGLTLTLPKKRTSLLIRYRRGS